MERPRTLSTPSPNTSEGRTSSSPLTMSIERPTVSAVSELPCSSRLIISSNRRATRSASRCSPEMVISLPRTKTVLSNAASMSLSSSSLVPSRLTMEWLPGTSTLTWVCCCTLASGPSVEALDRHRLDLVGQLEAEDAAEEVQLGLDRALDVLGLAQAVALAREGQVGVGDALLGQGAHHHLGLGRRHHHVVEPLDQDHRAGDAVGGVQR